MLQVNVENGLTLRCFSDLVFMVNLLFLRFHCIFSYCFSCMFSLISSFAPVDKIKPRPYILMKYLFKRFKMYVLF